MKSNDEMISIIIPVFNGEAFIRDAIESALDQNVKMEIIIIDDCSKDSTKEIVDSYLNTEIVSYYYNNMNEGVASTRNKGVSLAKGKYIAFLDADDFWVKDKLKKQLLLLEKTQGVLCCTARELIQADGKTTGKIIGVDKEIDYNRLKKTNCISCSSVLVKREIAKEFPMEHDDAHEDYLTWLKIARKYGKFYGINEPLLKYRLSPNGKSRNKFKSAQMTYKTFKYMGYNFLKCNYLMLFYIMNGIWKYRK